MGFRNGFFARSRMVRQGPLIRSGSGSARRIYRGRRSKAFLDKRESRRGPAHPETSSNKKCFGLRFFCAVKSPFENDLVSVPRESCSNRILHWPLANPARDRRSPPISANRNRSPIARRARLHIDRRPSHRKAGQAVEHRTVEAHQNCGHEEIRHAYSLLSVTTRPVSSPSSHHACKPIPN